MIRRDFKKDGSIRSVIVYGVWLLCLMIVGVRAVVDLGLRSRWAMTIGWVMVTAGALLLLLASLFSMTGYAQ